MREPVLSLRGISKRYGPLEVLKSVDLDVYPGEVVALLGENGAGKSTLSGIIAGSRELNFCLRRRKRAGLKYGARTV